MNKEEASCHGLRLSRVNRRPSSPCKAFAALALLASACPCMAEPLVKTFAEDPVNLTISVEPPKVDLAKDIEVTLELSCPDSVTASLPEDLSDRFDGFTVAGSYASADAPSGAMKRTTYHYRLTPVAAAKAYRIRPFAVSVSDASSHPPKSSWFATEMIKVDDGRTTSDAPETVSTNLQPRYVKPSFRNVPKLLGLGIAAALGLLLLAYAASKIRMHHKIRRMTPRERALRELEILLGRRLPEKGLFKDFYIELTLVVRRYIERRHGIRAPEQTTEEFLAAAASHGGFSGESIRNLKQFLSTADLVKFAGVSATTASAAEATDKARAYIELENAQTNDVAAQPKEKTK